VPRLALNTLQCGDWTRRPLCTRFRRWPRGSGLYPTQL